MENPLISIIIPVYNGEKYLRPCLDSIIKQTYVNWEMILIDDGSTDGSGTICDEYAKNTRVSVFHKKNEGQAKARNMGIEMAKGDYISFVDCDDWLEPDMYEKMVATLQSQQAEILICGYYEEYTSRRKEIHHDGELMVYEAKEALKMILDGGIGSYLWSMLFHRDVVKELMPNLKQYEDHATIFKWVAHAHRVVVWHHAFYHYRQLEGSSLHSFDPKSGHNFFLAVKERYHYIADKNLLPGWEKENRRLYLRGCLKLTKDIARMPHYDSQQRALIGAVRDELKLFLPISRQEIGGKYYVRLRLLLMNIDVFVRILRLSSMFSLGKKVKGKQLFH